MAEDFVNDDFWRRPLFYVHNRYGGAFVQLIKAFRHRECIFTVNLRGFPIALFTEDKSCRAPS